ncbi:MAG: hypothetical protein H8D22_04615 [Candidatus Cloacimonetes bacterium]|nr:hypothetical protein [Candidatus Cloacimonadota bacterium]
MIISIIAILISIGSFIFALITHSRQIVIKTAQKYQELRIDLYEICISMSKLIDELNRAEKNEYQEVIECLLTSIEGLIKVKKGYQDLSMKASMISWHPLYSKIEVAMEEEKGDIEELKRTVESAWDSYDKEDLKQLEIIAKVIKERVFGKKYLNHDQI